MPATRTRRRVRPLMGDNLELVSMFNSWARDEQAQEAALAEAEEYGYLAEGTGSPEGRADFALFMLSISRHRLREGFATRASQWRRYMGVERAEDFREHTASQLGGISGMGPVPEADEYPRLRSTEHGAPPYAIGKHGGVYAITLEMIVNDETNKILNRIPTELGKTSAAYVAQIVAALIESNPNYIDGLPFFTATARDGLPNGNEYTGSAAEPSEDNLVTIVSDLENTRNEEGFPMDITANAVLTRDRRTELIFRRIIRSQRTGTASNDTGATVADKGDLNIAAGLLPGNDPVIVEPYLNDPNDWILLADTGRPAFFIAFLRDMQEPFIGVQDNGIRAVGGGASENYTLDGDEMRFKIRHFFGVALGEPRSARRARRA